MGNNVSPACPVECETNSRLVNAEIKWTINNFGFKSACANAGSILESAQFCSEENPRLKWRLRLYPGGITTKAAEDNISLYLVLVSSSGESCATQYKFTVWDAAYMEKELTTRTISNVFQEGSSVWGARKLIKKDQVADIQSLVIHCQLTYELPGTLLTTIEKHPAITTSPGSTLNSHIQLLFDNGSNTDVCFLVNDQEIRAHKLILSSRSPVFAAMFDHDMKEKRSGIVDIVGISPDTFRTVLRFMYTDQVELKKEEDAKKLIAAADKYKLDLLRMECEKFLIRGLTWSNCLELLILSDLHKCTHLRETAMKFIRKHTTQLMKTEGWKILKGSHPRLIWEITEDFALIDPVAAHQAEVRRLAKEELLVNFDI